jgi:hypothetical protein
VLHVGPHKWRIKVIPHDCPSGGAVVSVSRMSGRAARHPIGRKLTSGAGRLNPHPICWRGDVHRERTRWISTTFVECDHRRPRDISRQCGGRRMGSLHETGEGRDGRPRRGRTAREHGSSGTRRTSRPQWCRRRSGLGRDHSVKPSGQRTTGEDRAGSSGGHTVVGRRRLSVPDISGEWRRHGVDDRRILGQRQTAVVGARYHLGLARHGRRHRQTSPGAGDDSQGVRRLRHLVKTRTVTSYSVVSPSGAGDPLTCSSRAAVT